MNRNTLHWSILFDYISRTKSDNDYRIWVYAYFKNILV